MTKLIEKYALVGLCILGSLVRLIYGVIYEPWTQAPDHLAWELILEQGSFRYDHLIHYPHEGGTILVSLVGQFFELFTHFSSLVISAFLLDFLVRFIQLKIVKTIFGQKAFLWFGVWTLFAAPAIIPWATVNFGLHSIASIFPFLLIYLLSLNHTSRKHHLICGLFLGLAFWFSYINIILIPIYFGYKIVRREKSINILYSIISLVGIIAIHFCIRHFLDAGFHLNEQTLNSIRGEGLIQNDLQLWDQLTDIPRVLVNSALSIPGSNTFMMLFRPIYYSLIVLSIIGIIRAYRASELNKIALITLPLIASFMSLYVIGPFFFSKDMGTHVSFRHLTYILPLFVLFMILGLRSIPKIKSFVIMLFLGIGAFRTLQLFTLEKAPYNEMIVKASGWTIGTKFGHDPKVIIEIIEKNQAQKKLLIEGVGWGISTALFEQLEAQHDSLEINQRIQTLSELMDQLPNYQPTLEEGIRFSFSDQVSPRLDTLIFARFADKAANQPKKQ